MKKALLVIAILGLSVLPLMAQTNPFVDYSNPVIYEIGGIEVEGATYNDANSIKNFSGLVEGDKIRIPGDMIPKAINKLWNLRLFTDVEIYISKKIGDVIFLTIAVEELPHLSRYSYTGVKKSLHDDLNKEIDKYLLKGGIVTEDIKMNCKSALQDYFIGKGFLDTDVTVREISDTTQVYNSVRLLFDINIKSKVKIDEIVFSGNKEVKEKKLRKLMKETKRKARPIRFKSSRYVRDQYRDDLKNIVAFYNKQGYRDAHVKRDSVYRNGEFVRVEIDIDEGNRYYFRNIDFKGNTIKKTSLLQNILGIKKGDVYNQELLETRLRYSPDGRDVTSEYMDDGYLFFQVNPAEIMVDGDSIDLEIRIFEGPQATIDRVVINGNDRTHEHVIRREIRTQPGQKFSRADIIRSQREIANLGYFNAENLGINTPVNPQRGTVDIEYTVEERPSDQLELSAGWGGRGRGVIGTLGVTFNNFSLRNMFKKETWSPLPQGDGQRLSIRAQTNGQFFQSYNFSFTEPWLGGKKPNSFTIGGFHSRYSLGDKESTSFQRLSISGASVGLGIRMKFPDDYFVSNTTLGYQRIGLGNWTGFFVDNNTRINNGKFNNINLNQTFSRSNISNPIFPSSGARFSLSMQFTPPYSLFRKKDFWVYSDDERNNAIIDENALRDDDGLAALTETQEAAFITEAENAKKFKFLEYHKWRFNAEWYNSLFGNEKLVLKIGAKIGMIGTYNKNIGLSPFERFELGGDGISNQAGLEGKDIISLRGYDSDDLSANGSGGAGIFDKFTMELRYLISPSPSATVYVLAFVEGGNSWNNFQEFNPLDLRRSTGAGIRIFLPMFGTLGFDYGIGFDKSLGEGAKLKDYGRFSIILGFEPE